MISVVDLTQYLFKKKLKYSYVYCKNMSKDGLLSFLAQWLKKMISYEYKLDEERRRINATFLDIGEK